MQSKTELCNGALLRIGHTELIANIETEKSLAAEQCREFWKVSLNAVLEGTNPFFARRIVKLAILTNETSPEFEYVYSMPSDCLVPRQVITENSVRTRTFHADLDHDFIKGMATNSKEKTILTNLKDAYLIYTTSDVQTFMFDNAFCLSFSLLMGSNLALSLKKDAKLAANLNKSYQNTLSKSEAIDANAQNTDVNYAYGFECAAIKSRL